jgi:hypothetical protein
MSSVKPWRRSDGAEAREGRRRDLAGLGDLLGLDGGLRRHRRAVGAVPRGEVVEVVGHVAHHRGNLVRALATLEGWPVDALLTEMLSDRADAA